MRTASLGPLGYIDAPTLGAFWPRNLLLILAGSRCIARFMYHSSRTVLPCCVLYVTCLSSYGLIGSSRLVKGRVQWGRQTSETKYTEMWKKQLDPIPASR